VTVKLIYLARRAASVSREDWPHTWKSHAVFASQFPALETGIDWMRYCNRIDADIPGLSSAHDGVAIAVGPSLAALNGSGFSAADRALIDHDELRVFDMLTPNFTFYCAGDVVRDGPLGEVALFRFLARRPGISAEVFADIWQRKGLPFPAATRIVRNRPLDGPLPLFPFDGIEEVWFATQADALSASSASVGVPATSEWCDTARSVSVLTGVCHRWLRQPKA